MHRFFKKDGDISGRIADDRSRRPRRRRPGLECLEGRQLLSFLGSETQVNPADIDRQSGSANASSLSGTSVVVWVDEFAGGDRNIHAQRFGTNGQPAGPTISVDSSFADSAQPAVAMDSKGNFAVTWTNFVPGNANVMARYYTADGVPASDTIKVAGSFRQEFSPDVAASDGSFVVSYSQLFSPADSDIRAHRYTVSAPSGNAPTIVDAGDFGVATASTNNESSSSIAMAPSGAFSVAYQFDFSITDSDVKLARFSPNGSLVAAGVDVASGTLNEGSPDIAMDAAGNAVVVYQKAAANRRHSDIKARRVTNTGAMGAEVNVSSTNRDETNPSVALARTGGQFLVAYQTNGIGSGMEVVRMNQQASTPPVILGSVAGFDPQVSIDGSGRFLVTYTKNTPNQTDVFSRRDALS